ncbi:hypothetical protein BGE01nite_40510 [Brevifollis gellanilyticus]|uniref:Uncharacterized protein n=1 Tax=Brevifollis gellanilyticus TaxID=748831 RepID=A0A512MDE6_9BACT|nr:hypothetical protein BGE01nite_40510 [Brevifollis gellanilyticus]
MVFGESIEEPSEKTVMSTFGSLSKGEVQEVTLIEARMSANKEATMRRGGRRMEFPQETKDVTEMQGLRRGGDGGYCGSGRLFMIYDL